MLGRHQCVVYTYPTTLRKIPSSSHSTTHLRSCRHRNTTVTRASLQCPPSKSCSSCGHSTPVSKSRSLTSLLDLNETVRSHFNLARAAAIRWWRARRRTSQPRRPQGLLSWVSWPATRPSNGRHICRATKYTDQRA